MATCCLHCDARLSSRELADGWCDTCGKKLSTFLDARAVCTQREAVTAPVAAKPAGERVSIGQMLLIGLFVLAVGWLIVSAVQGDPKSLRAVGRIAGIAFVGVVAVCLRGLWALIRGNSGQ